MYMEFQKQIVPNVFSQQTFNRFSQQTLQMFLNINKMKQKKSKIKFIYLFI